MKAQWFNSVDQIGEATWQAAIGETRYPFAQFAFHQALEQSKSIGDGTGWYPEYLLVMNDDDSPLAIAPTYLKTHSQGEFVFDWAWADAYQRYGMNYFPKRIWAVPFSPVTGVRLFSHMDPKGDDAQFSHLYPALAEIMTQANQERDFSSWHLLFTKPEHADLFRHNKDLLQRISCQFHWFNRGYKDMEDYLSHFASRKRKAARKEREKVAKQGITLTRTLGSELTSAEIDFFYLCYQSTYAKRGQQGYLTREFFGQLAETMGEQILLVQALKMKSLSPLLGVFSTIILCMAVIGVVWKKWIACILKLVTTKASNFVWKKGYSILIRAPKGNTKSPEGSNLYLATAYTTSPTKAFAKRLVTSVRKRLSQCVSTIKIPTRCCRLSLTE